ncbi:RNA polymerase sigma factor [Fulvivirga lutimaris]|uniref:RNA polymerase sigma factor n=1 Tax=Fulvivirga lutimaris TaxID=1819566 RepID=UPI0012BBF9DA|nr:sigma-70 family RNA polymerase sigma factor [Fulvivirga lutimaris]MTI38896.1 sigma-70 family RNA polymerase sigma factor [Fulvivirga lutimaris]
MTIKRKSKDSTVFEQAIEDHKDSLYRICHIYAADPLEPADLFQEVVFQAWRSYSSFEEKSRLGTWLYRVAINVCLSAKLKLNRKNDITVKLDAISFQIGKWDEKRDERYEALKSCIEILNESDKSLVVLYLEELSYKEIGSIHGMTENHVAVKMKRIRKKLFDCITKKLGA